jgi:opacity protein-like surface antigen
MLGGGVTYSPVENWAIDCSISKFMGEEGTHFKEMENFSHLSLGVKYSF